MTALLGVNVAGRAEYTPANVAALGARWARCVAYPDADIRDWIRGCHERGIKVLLVLASESIGPNPAGWPGAIDAYAERYLGLVDAWQLGNESDQVSDSSWTLSQADLTRLLKIGRQVLGTTAYIVGPGLVSGQPGWLQGVDLSFVNAIACHPYAKWPGTADLSNMLNGYAAYGKPLWVTEYHARTIGMAAALRDDPRLQVALAFCYSDAMVRGFGLIENPAALADFKAATALQNQVPNMPETMSPHYVLGFKDWHDRDPALLGDPLEDERGGVPGFSVQRTTKGRLMACNLVGRGWTLTFWRDDDGSRWLYLGNQSEQIA